MRRLEDKIAVVMGASRTGNMGQAIAARFMAEGAKVVVAGRGMEGLQAFATRTGATAQRCDISSKAEVQALTDAVLAEHGAIDIAVNAAATGQYSPFEQTSEAEIDEMLAIIFKGSFFFMQAMVGAMKRERTSGRGGAIINISSAVADIMFENHAAYMGAKAGMNQVTRTVANEFGQFGIRANTISPGLTITPMLGSFMAPGMVDAFIKEYPLGRLTTVEDVANAALFVASDECFMTGQTFHVTGGLTLRRNPTAAEIAASVQAAATAGGGA
jgi:NAD(P)-dependent dehydrogenase (short-subunit alcohol dehydrogenase family)